ncbi:MAG: DUF4163 domain-containing protein [Lachnospiraceae bacterium]|nr:DUF4163 domain-containing protein [Lachnospiraceae bacterium]
MINRVKKGFLIGIAILILTVVSIFVYCLSYRNYFDSISTKAMNMIEIRSEQYLLERNKEDGSFWYRIEVNYPQIANASEACSMEKINMHLRDAAFSLYEKTYEEAITYLKENTEYEASTEIEYDILQLSDVYISLIFNVVSVTGGPSYMQHYLMTINVSDGEYILLKDLENSDKLISLVESGTFEVFEGTYSELHEDYFHEPEAIKRLVEMLENELENHTLNGGFDRYSSQNIGMDEENLYFYFPFEEAFHGYVILRVPWENEKMDNIRKSMDEAVYDKVIADYIIMELNETPQNIVSHADYGIGIDYDFINENHVILAHNICESPNYDYENTPLAEYLREDVEDDREMEKAGLVATLEIDYFTYDFNADGLEDYLVCMHGFLWGGSGGNTVRIYIQDKDESLRQVLDITVRLHEPNIPNEHDAIAVLDEMTGGYYAIVLPGTNRILRYDENTGGYEFQEGE